jgi:hypothetical protein
MPPAEYFDILFLGSGQRSKQPRSAAVECAAALAVGIRAAACTA